MTREYPMIEQHLKPKVPNRDRDLLADDVIRRERCTTTAIAHLGHMSTRLR